MSAGTSGQSVPPRVGLFGPYVSRNLGDTATQMAMIQNLRTRCPEIEIIGVAPEPEDTVRSLGIPAFPLSGIGPTAGNPVPYAETSSVAVSNAWRRPYSPLVVRRIDRFVRTLDVLIVSGGGQLDDFWGGAWNHPWSMLLWTVLARRHGIPVVYLAIGVDGLKEPLSRRFSLWALNLAQRRLFRDAGSLHTMQKLGLERQSEVCPDLVFALDTKALPANDPDVADKGFVVLSPISRKTWSRDETEAHGRYMAALVSTGAELAARGYGLRVVCSQSRMDTEDAGLLVALLKESGVRAVTLVDAPEVGDFLSAVRGAELVVASRLHGVILSLVAGCPVVALAHLAKVEAVMADFELSRYCLLLQTIETRALSDLVFDSLKETESLRSRIEQTRSEFRNRLIRVLDDTARLARSTSSTA